MFPEAAVQAVVWRVWRTSEIDCKTCPILVNEESPTSDCGIHKTLRITPAIEANRTDHVGIWGTTGVRDFPCAGGQDTIVARIDANEVPGG